MIPSFQGNTHHSHGDQPHHGEHEHRVYHTAAVAAGTVSMFVGFSSELPCIIITNKCV